MTVPEVRCRIKSGNAFRPVYWYEIYFPEPDGGGAAECISSNTYRTKQEAEAALNLLIAAIKPAPETDS